MRIVASKIMVVYVENDFIPVFAFLCDINGGENAIAIARGYAFLVFLVFSFAVREAA